jgi:hypothetical protein
LFGVITALAGMVPVLGAVADIFFFAPFGVVYGYLIYENLRQVKT